MVEINTTFKNLPTRFIIRVVLVLCLLPGLHASAQLQDPQDDVWPGRHLFITVHGTYLRASTQAFLREIKPGGVILMGNNIKDREQTIRLIRQIKEAVGLGTGVADLPLIAVDQEGGLVNRLRLQQAPSAQALGRIASVRQAHSTGQRYAEECLDRGIAVILAPVLDVYEPGAPKSMRSRMFGNDPALVTAMGLSFADGIMRGGVLAVAKHFPGHGAVKQDSHHRLAIADKDLKGLSQALMPFQQATLHDMPGVMVGHIAVPAIDREHPNRPASVSPVTIGGLLRRQWNYDGVILSDDLNMGAIRNAGSVAQAAVDSITAGCDALIFVDPDLNRILELVRAIEQSVLMGDLTREQLAASSARLDAWQRWLHSPTRLKGPLPAVPPRSARVKIAVSAEDVPVTKKQAPAVGGTQYTVSRGDTLGRLAQRFGVSMNTIMRANGITNPNRIRIGQALTIPAQ